MFSRHLQISSGRGLRLPFRVVFLPFTIAPFFRLLINISHLKSMNFGMLDHVISNGHDHDIESAGGERPAKDDGSRPSIFSIEAFTGYEQDDRHWYQSPKLVVDNTDHRNRTQPSVEAIIAIVAMGSTIVVGLMAVNSPGHMINGGDDGTTFLDRHPMFSCSFLVIGTATFYFIAVGAMICRLHPNIARMLNLAALLLAVLAVTLLLWAFLPKTLRWVPWIFFAITVLAALLVQLYEWLWATPLGSANNHISWAWQWRDTGGHGLPTIYTTTRTPNNTTAIRRNSASHHILLASSSTSSRLRRPRSDGVRREDALESICMWEFKLVPRFIAAALGILIKN